MSTSAPPMDPLVRALVQPLTDAVVQMLNERFTTHDRDLLSTKDISARTGISETKIRDLTTQGVIRSVKVDGSRKVRFEDYQSWLASLSTT
jgi:excisionase family DNA binding protein